MTVKNLAIVEDLEMELDRGLTVITGETGAGKSILVDALALLAGGRSSQELLRAGADRLSVAGEFDADGGVRELLSVAGHADTSPTILLRRDLTADGKGRAYVEDEPAAVRTLSKVGERLVEIHGQNSEQGLTDPGAPLELLDGYARAEAEAGATALSARNWTAAREALETLQASRRDRASRLDLLDFQIREIRGASPDEKEEEELGRERALLLHADRIRNAAETALASLSEAEGSAADRLGEAARAFAELAAIDSRERPHLEEAEDLKRRIADLAATARDAAARAEGDPERLSRIESRLEEWARLKRKYGLSLMQLRELLDRLGVEREELANLDDSLTRREREEREARERYTEAAAALSQKRRSAAARFSAAVEKELISLAMEKARFRFLLTTVAEEQPRPSGRETAALLFAPNPGEPEKPLEKIASGGELARLQLAIRSVAAARTQRQRTLVFDEVDSGIGGRTAEVVGRKLRALARHDQVLCVTHVPQIAALADRHFRAEKAETRGRTVARVRRLEGSERVAEIARMLAGEKVPDTAMRHARTLLAQAGQAT